MTPPGTPSAFNCAARPPWPSLFDFCRGTCRFSSSQSAFPNPPGIGVARVEPCLEELLVIRNAGALKLFVDHGRNAMGELVHARVRHRFAVARDRVEDGVDVLLVMHRETSTLASSKIAVRVTPLRASYFLRASPKASPSSKVCH